MQIKRNPDGTISATFSEARGDVTGSRSDGPGLVTEDEPTARPASC